MNYSSKKIISYGFMAMLLILILIITVGLSSISSLHNKIEDLVNNRNVKISIISDMRNIARDRSLLLYQIVLLKDPFETDEKVMQMSELAGIFMAKREQLFQLDLTASEDEMIQRTLEIVYHSTGIQKKLLEMIKKESFEQAELFLMDTAIPEQNMLLTAYDSLLDYQEELSQQDAFKAENKYNNTWQLLTLSSFLVVCIGLMVSFFVIRKTTSTEKQLHDLNETLEHRVQERTISLYQSNQELELTIKTLKETQEQLVQAEKMASMGGLVAGVAHEINTPIGVGLTAVSYLHEQGAEIYNKFESKELTEEDFLNFIKNIQDSSQLILLNIKRASNLIQNFKRVAVDQNSDDFVTINLHDYIDEVLLSLNPKIKTTEISIKNHCEADIFIVTNPSAIYQILSNLIFNSITHGFEENKPGNIDIHSQKTDHNLLIKFCDDGKGISADNIDKVFEPFFTTRRDSGGTGLGLHIVYNLVTTTLHGIIQIEKNFEKGCCFHIQLPRLDKQN